MRNSSEVGKLAETLKSEDSDGRKITNLIKSLPTSNSSITSTKPTLFPISIEDLEENCFKVFEKATEKGDLKVILIDDERIFDAKRVKKALLKCDINEEDIFVHTFKSNNTKEDIELFLENENGFLICEAELFTGMEADSVVYCVTDRGKNIRVNVLRACSKLSIIYAYRKDFDECIDFRGAKLDPTFMTGCDEKVEDWSFKCFKCEYKVNKSGNDKEDKDGVIICKSCFIRCHSGHEAEPLLIENDMTRCECQTSCSNCNFT